jgi:hypothetical protein
VVFEQVLKLCQKILVTAITGHPVNIPCLGAIPKIIMIVLIWPKTNWHCGPAHVVDGTRRILMARDCMLGLLESFPAGFWKIIMLITPHFLRTLLQLPALTGFKLFCMWEFVAPKC